MSWLYHVTLKTWFSEVSELCWKDPTLFLSFSFSLFLLCLHDTYGCFPTTLLEHWFSRCSSQSSKGQHLNKKTDLYRLPTKCKSEARQQKLNFVKGANAVWYQTITAIFKCQTFLMKGLSFFEQWNMDFRSVVLYS